MIVITTPTGRIGRDILVRVQAAGAPVRAIARHPGKLPASVDAVAGSHDDAEVLTAALDGADTLFWLVPPDFGAPDPAAHYERFTSALTAVLARHPVRVVAVSSLGHGYRQEAGLLSPAWAMEDAIAATGVALRALRLPYFMENLLGQAELIGSQGMIAMANAPDQDLATVATRDAAAVAADLLLDAEWSDQAGVPVVSDRLTPTAMTKTIADVLDREVRLTPITTQRLKAMLAERGASEGWALGVSDMVTAQNDGVYEAEPNGVPPASRTGFRDWCRQVLAPAVTA